MNVLICGSRDFANAEIVDQILNSCFERAIESNDSLVVIHGACNTELDTRPNKVLGEGADALAHDWCQLMLASVYEIEERQFPANWKEHGRQAGYIRNAQMLEEGQPDIVYGFMNVNSPGTTMMLDLAKKAGIPTYRIQEW